MEMSLKKPDFFIVGAPKSGTSALSFYLNDHPDVFLPTSEPHFFADGVDPRFNGSVNAYLKWFEEASGCKRVGDKSVSYLYSEKARKNIYEFQPRAQIIIMIRNPVDLVYSLHGEMCSLGHEFEPDFQKALELEESRKSGKNLPEEEWVRPWFLFYKYMGHLTQHVKGYCEIFGKENVHIIIYDDFAENTKEEYRKVLRFLGINDKHEPDVAPVRRGKVPRSKMLHRLIHRPPRLLRWITELASPRLRRKLFKGAKSANTVERRREPLSNDLREELKREFRKDVIELGEYLSRDLSHWVK